MYWDEKDGNWFLKTKKATFHLKKTGKLYWVQMELQGEFFAVFEQVWGYDPLLVRCDTLKQIGMNISKARRSKT